jgi:hypothetical protein
MKQVQLNISGTGLDFKKASALAASCAGSDIEMEMPVLVAWHDKRMSRMSPVIEGADINSRWRDYGESHNGCLEVDVGGDYDFIFADSAAFDDYGPSPYINIKDEKGQEYICQIIDALHGGHSPDMKSCVPLDEYTSKMT